MDRIFVVRRDGLTCYWRDGDSWTVEERQPAAGLECIAVAPDGEIVLCGSFESGIYRSEDRGETFSRVSDERIREAAVTSLAFDPSDSSVVLAGTEPSLIYRSTDAGESWSEIEGLTEVPSARTWSFPPRPDTHHVRWLEIAPADPARWYVGVEAGALVLTPDAGETWIDRPAGSRRDNHWLATHSAEPERVYSAAGDGYAESYDGGESWDHPQEGLGHRYVWSVAVDEEDPDVRLISAAHSASRAHRSATAESYVYRRRDAEPWEVLDADGLPTGDGVLRYVLVSGDRGGTFVGASNRGTFLTTDGGVSWEALDRSVDSPDATVRGIATA